MHRLPRAFLAVAILFISSACAATASAPSGTSTATAPAIVTGEVRYGADPGGEAFVGHLALSAADGASRPAVLVVHEWWGRTDHADRSAEDLAKLGYVALAVDMYGGGRRTDDRKLAAEWSGSVKNSPDQGVGRVEAALAFLSSQPAVDRTRVAIIGYCFGGRVALDAAWAGLDLRAAVSFHGSLTTPTAEQARTVSASILVLHGADDPTVSDESIDAFETSMKAHDFDWAMTWYGNAVHSFTNSKADGSASAASKYEPRATERSWDAMKGFLAERLK